MKSSNIVLYLALSIGFTLNAQKYKAELIFIDGTKMEGFANLKSSDEIRFRRKREAQRQIYTFDEVDTLKIHYKYKSRVYVKVRIVNKDKPKVLELVDAGKRVHCYQDVFAGYGPPAMVLGTGFNESHMGRNHKVTNFYLRKPQQEEVTYLASTDWLSKNFKKAASKFFSDCSRLVAKIQNRELKKKHFKQIITYYNTQCK